MTFPFPTFKLSCTSEAFLVLRSVNLPLFLIRCVSDPRLHALDCGTAYCDVYVLSFYYSTDFHREKRIQCGGDVRLKVQHVRDGQIFSFRQSKNKRVKKQTC